MRSVELHTMASEPVLWRAYVTPSGVDATKPSSEAPTAVDITLQACWFMGLVGGEGREGRGECEGGIGATMCVCACVLLVRGGDMKGARVIGSAWILIPHNCFLFGTIA